MSTAIAGATPSSPLPKVENMRVAIVTAEWNGHITSKLRQGALDLFASQGFDMENDVECFDVPGAVELTFAASQLIETELFDVVIVFGCVIDYVCQSVTQGVTELNSDCTIPVIFGLLTVENEQQALERVGGPMGHKGVEAAETAIRMVAFKRRVESL